MIKAKIINRRQLFVASCLALLVTSLSFGIRAGILNNLAIDFQLTNSELSTVTATAFWGFPLAVIFGGMLVDYIGMKRLLVLAFIFHLLGIVLTVTAQGYWTLFISTLMVGIANGTVEAACNPLVTALYPEKRTAMLNYFHLWFPGGIVLGTLVVLLFNNLGLGWQVQMGIMILPTLVYGYLFSRLDFPVTERVAAGISTATMYKSIASPLFIFMFICMFGTAITELFTGQWIDVLLHNVTDNAILILTLTTGVMAIGRAFADPVMRVLSPERVLLFSIIVTSLGLYLLSTFTGNAVYFSAIIFGIGVCYLWPTMLGFVAENIPHSGALGMNVMAGAGMFAVTVYTLFMGDYYDNLVLESLPTGSDIVDYLKSESGTAKETLLSQAKSIAGPKVLQITMRIPIALIFAFIGLNVYMNKKKKINEG